MTPLDSFIQERFAQAGYDLEVDSKGRYYAGMWRLLGGEAHLLRSEPILRLLSNAQLRRGRAFTYRELLGFAQPGRKAAVEAFNRRLMALEARQILLRGYNVQCATCDLVAWYEPGQIGSGVCLGCRSPLALPLELAFAFRLNQLFMEGLKQGALTVLLTLAHIQPAAWWAGLIASRDGQKTDLDLVLHTAEGNLLVAECKDNFGRGGLARLEDQIERGARVAATVGAAYVLATLAPAPSEAIQQFNVPVLLRGTLLGTGDEEKG